MAYSLRCPDCRDKFPWNPSAAWPRFCPLCAADIRNERDDSDIVMPFIRSSEKTKRIDQTYRDLEVSSEHRAQIAAQQAGVDVSEMSSLKITNIRDTKPGEIAHVPVDNEVTRQMARSGRDGWGDQQAGSEYAAGTATGAVSLNGRITQGIAPRAGANAMAQLQSVLPPIPGIAAVRK